MYVWAGSLPSACPCLAHRWFPGLECPFRHWEKHNKFVGEVIGKAGRGKEADFCPRVGGWGCGVHSWLSLTHLQQGGMLRKALVGTWGGTGSSWQCLALGAQGGCREHRVGARNTPSALVCAGATARSPGLPQQKSQPFVGKTPPLGSWVIQKPQAVPAQHPEECGGGSVEFPHRDSEGFSELAPLTCCLPVAKGQVAVVPSRISPQAGSWAAPRPVQITQQQRGQALPCLCSSIPADCWNICQRVLWLLPEGCCVQLFVVFIFCKVWFFYFAKFCFLSPSVENGAWNSEMLDGFGH